MYAGVGSGGIGSGRFRKVGSGRFRRVPARVGVGSGGFRRVPARVGVVPEAGFGRFGRVPVWFVALQP